MEQRSEEIIAFQKRAMKMLLEFAKREGIRSTSDLNSKKAMIMFEQPLWQILEANRKYGGPLISEGVKAVEDRIGRRVSASSGTWPERQLVEALGEREDGESRGVNSPITNANSNTLSSGRNSCNGYFSNQTAQTSCLIYTSSDAWFSKQSIRDSQDRMLSSPVAIHGAVIDSLPLR